MSSVWETIVEAFEELSSGWPNFGDAKASDHGTGFWLSSRVTFVIVESVAKLWTVSMLLARTFPYEWAINC
jgi:hypothetical protein